MRPVRAVLILIFRLVEGSVTDLKRHDRGGRASAGKHRGLKYRSDRLSTSRGERCASNQKLLLLAKSIKARDRVRAEAKRVAQNAPKV